MASGQTLEEFVPGDGSYVPSEPVLFGPDANGLTCYMFPNGSEGWLLFDGFLGQQYGGSGLTFKLAWCCASTTGVVKWGLSLQRLNAGLVLNGSLSWGTESSQTVAVPGVAYQLVYTTFTISADQIPILPGEIYRIRLRRDVSPSNNSPGVAEFFRLLSLES